jgi:dephospho-CoA kinase
MARSRLRLEQLPAAPALSAAASVPFIGLTGGIGAGKSTALAALERLGAAVLSSDSLVHELYRSEAVRAAVRERFGEQVMREGEIDRAALAVRVFASAEDRVWLERLLWPLVGERIAAWRAQQQRRRPPPRALAVEVPLLFEAGMEGVFDATITVIADERLRARRAAGRGHQALDARAARQLSQEEKAARATYVVVNDGSIAALERRLRAVLDDLARS